MKSFFFIAILVFFASCDFDINGELKGNKLSGGGAGDEGIEVYPKYSHRDASSYLSIDLNEDGTFILIQYMDFGSIMWMESRGTYTINGTTLTATNVTYTDANAGAGGLAVCGVAAADYEFEFSPDYESLTMTNPPVGIPMTDEATNGFSMPDITSEPGLCP